MAEDKGRIYSSEWGGGGEKLKKEKKNCTGRFKKNKKKTNLN